MNMHLISLGFIQIYKSSEFLHHQLRSWKFQPGAAGRQELSDLQCLIVVALGQLLTAESGLEPGSFYMLESDTQTMSVQL